MPSVFEARDLHYSYRVQDQEVPVLKGIDLSVAAGSFACLVGPSGSGKTTLLNLLGLLDKPQRGTLRLYGEDMTALGEDDFEAIRLRRLGFVFQTFHLIPTLTALENTAYFLEPLGLGRREAEGRARETLRLVGLADHADKRPGQLSGGQCQRVAIARAVAKGPEVLLADEPTANLDRRTAEEIVAILQELRAKQKISLIFATHDLHLVSHAETVYRLQDGRLEPETAPGLSAPGESLRAPA